MIFVPPAIVIVVDSPASFVRMLDVIAQVETGNSWDKRGPEGELSPWQISKLTWKQHMGMYPFDPCCRSHMLARECAFKHLKYVLKLLDQKHIPATPENIETVWNMGFGAGRKRILSGDIPDVAVRAGNLYRESLQTNPLN